MRANGTTLAPRAAPGGHASGSPTPGVDGAAFRQAMSRLAAGVSIITTTARDGQKIGLTATAITALSADPPLILACIGSWSRAVAPLEAYAPFVVHLLGADQQHLAQHFATTQPDKFAGIPHSVMPSGHIRLSDALAWIECLPHQIYLGGDHIIVVGRVAAIQVGADERAPLVYFRRAFHTLCEQQAAG